MSNRPRRKSESLFRISVNLEGSLAESMKVRCDLYSDRSGAGLNLSDLTDWAASWIARISEEESGLPWRILLLSGILLGSLRL